MNLHQVNSTTEDARTTSYFPSAFVKNLIAKTKRNARENTKKALSVYSKRVFHGMRKLTI